MEKHFVLAVGGAALISLAAGCGHTRIDKTPVSPEQRVWEDILRSEYPGWTPPPRTPAAFQGHTESRTSARVRQALIPMDDPEDELFEADDSADTMETALPQDVEELPTELPEPTDDIAETPADAPAETPAEAPAEAAAETPAEAPAEAAAETPAAAPAELPAGTVAPPDPTSSVVYEVKSGDTLGAISQRFYGNAGFSNIIFKANTDILQDPNRLRPGMKLIIPKL